MTQVLAECTRSKCNGDEVYLVAIDLIQSSYLGTSRSEKIPKDYKPLVLRRIFHLRISVCYNVTTSGRGCHSEQPKQKRLVTLPKETVLGGLR